MNRNHVYRLIGLFAVLLLLAVTGCGGTESKRSTGTYIDDKTISSKIEGKLAADSLTQAIQVDVETYDGVVQLSGFVSEAATRERAEQIARSVPGVKGVKNNLVLRPSN